jgi:hypothetical protein
MLLLRADAVPASFLVGRLCQNRPRARSFLLNSENRKYSRRFVVQYLIQNITFFIAPNYGYDCIMCCNVQVLYTFCTVDFLWRPQDIGLAGKPTPVPVDF